MLELLAAGKPVVVQVQEGSGGASLGSILVFIAGVLAALAAVVAAIITSRGATSRLQKQLSTERERFDRQLGEEARRFEAQLEHDRWQAKRAEASAAIERISRLVGRTVTQFDDLVSLILEEDRSGIQKAETNLIDKIESIREEISVVAIRFGNDSSLVDRMMELLGAFKPALVHESEFPLSEERKAEIGEAADQAGVPAAQFLVTAKQVLDDC